MMHSSGGMGAREDVFCNEELETVSQAYLKKYPSFLFFFFVF
jgi:hypothetical protein